MHYKNQEQTQHEVPRKTFQNKPFALSAESRLKNNHRKTDLDSRESPHKFMPSDSIKWHKFHARASRYSVVTKNVYCTKYLNPSCIKNKLEKEIEQLEGCHRKKLGSFLKLPLCVSPL